MTQTADSGGPITASCSCRLTVYLLVKESIFPPLGPIAVSLIVFVPALRETGAEEMLPIVQVPVEGMADWIHESPVRS